MKGSRTRKNYKLVLRVLSRPSTSPSQFPPMPASSFSSRLFFSPISSSSPRRHHPALAAAPHHGGVILGAAGMGSSTRACALERILRARFRGQGLLLPRRRRGRGPALARIGDGVPCVLLPPPPEMGSSAPARCHGRAPPRTTCLGKNPRSGSYLPPLDRQLGRAHGKGEVQVHAASSTSRLALAFVQATEQQQIRQAAASSSGQFDSVQIKQILFS